MFSIIISEKGGAERRETFDKNEINVGRVQGNDLMLPKGNVSKHHARLLFRDGRFIVTDLKSTNGTYVNGRKIAQATIVREGDKIYIGDFVIRLEAQGQADAPIAPAEDESIRTLAREAAGPAPGFAPPPAQPSGPPGPRPAAMNAGPAATLKAATHPPNAPLLRPGAPKPEMAEQPAGRTPEPGEIEPVAAPAPPKPRPSIAPAAPPIPDAGPGPVVPPRVGPSIGAARAGVTMPLGGMGAPPRAASVAPPPVPPQPPPPSAAPPTAPPPPAPAPAAPAQAPVIQVAAPAPAQTTPPAAARPVTSPPPRQSKEQAGRRLAMQMLLDRIGEAVDLAPLQASVLVSDTLSQQLDRAARDQAAAMRTEGEAPEGIDPDALARDAHRELVHLGTLSSLLEDDDVSEVHCARFDQVGVVRAGQTQMAELGFSSEEALSRAVRRLCASAGVSLDSGESFVERRHPRGRFVAVLPPAAPASFVFRKRRRLDQSLEDLVRGQCMGRPVATFLEACVQGRANVLVVGQSLDLLGALVTASAPQDRIAIVSDTEEFSAPHAHLIATYAQDEKAHGEAAVRAAARMRTDRLIVTRLGGAITQATVDSIMSGTSGVVAGMVAPTLRQATSRLVSQLLLSRPGLPIEAAREAISEVFDVAVELGRADNGRERVVRVSEMSGTDPKGVALKDIFAAAADGEAIATGSTPRIAGELASRGVKVDPQVFKRR